MLFVSGINWSSIRITLYRELCRYDYSVRILDGSHWVEVYSCCFLACDNKLAREKFFKMANEHLEQIRRGEKPC